MLIISVFAVGGHERRATKKMSCLEKQNSIPKGHLVFRPDTPTIRVGSGLGINKKYFFKTCFANN